MKAKLKTALQWLFLVVVWIFMLPSCLLTGAALAALGSKPLIEERGTFDFDGTPVRYQVFSLKFPERSRSTWIVDFARLYSLQLLPSLFSGLRGWLSPAAVARLWLTVWQRGVGQ